MKIHSHNILPIPRKLFRYSEGGGETSSPEQEAEKARIKAKIERDKLAQRQWTEKELDDHFLKIKGNNKNAEGGLEKPGNAIDLANDLEEAMSFYNVEAKKIKKIEGEPDVGIAPQARSYLLGRCLEHHLTSNDFVIMHDPENNADNGGFSIKDVSDLPPDEKQAREQEAIKMMETITLFQDRHHILKSLDNIPTYLTYLTARAYHKEGDGDLSSHISTIEKKISKHIAHSPITEEDVLNSTATAHEKTMYLGWIHRKRNKDEIRKINTGQEMFVKEIKDNFDKNNPEKTREYIENHPFSAFAGMAVPGLITGAAVLFGLNMLFRKEGTFNKIGGGLLLMCFGPVLARMLDKGYQAVGGADLLKTDPINSADAKDNPINNTIKGVASIPGIIGNKINNFQSGREHPDNFITAVMDPDIHALLQDFPMEHILHSTQPNYEGSEGLSVPDVDKTKIKNAYEKLNSIQKNKLTALLECAVREVKEDTPLSRTEIRNLTFEDTNTKKAMKNFIIKKNGETKNTIYDTQDSWNAFSIIMDDPINWGDVTLGQIYEDFLREDPPGPKLEAFGGEIITAGGSRISVSQGKNFIELRDYFKAIFPDPPLKDDPSNPNALKRENFDITQKFKDFLQQLQ